MHEDLGRAGDVTTRFILDRQIAGRGRLLAKSSGIVAGLPVFQRVMHKVDRQILCRFESEDGTKVDPGTIIGHVSGRLASILTAERTALNFLQRFSGIATLTGQFVSAVAGTGAVILDTRKTLPAYRWLDKYAVRQGGARNHRHGLYDMILIKDNHIEAAGSLSAAVERCLTRMKRYRIAIEVETRSIDEVMEALRFPVQRILLDNMPIPMLKKAVREINGVVETEASGGITLENVRQVAEAGVNFISIGALTHSVRALDIALDITGE